jgi:UDP-GlcNAc:undecaprenyl-phosphate GlcNAc-1-phosphate transferase
MINLPSFVAAMAISMVLIPLMSRLAPLIGLVDIPNERKVHAVPVPRVGGIGLVIGSLVPLMMLLEPSALTQSFVYGGSVLFLFGLWDDVFEIGHYPKFIGQIASALIVIFYGDLYVTSFPFVPGELAPEIGIPFTVVAFVGAINAINHSDGLDGLAGGESLFSLGAISLLSFLVTGGEVALTVAITVIGGILGFLRYNAHPARVFMGDSGSQFIGFTLAFLAIYLTQVIDPGLSPAVVLFLFGLPIADILAVFYMRARSGMNVFRATRNHVHHRLLDLGFVHRESVIIIYSIQMVFVTTGVLLRQESNLLLVILYVVYCASIFGLINWAERTGWKAARNQSGADRLMSHDLTKNLLVVLPRKFMAVSIPVFLIGGSVLVSYVPDDFSKTALLVSGLIVIDLFTGSGQRSIMRRALIYVIAAQVAYLWMRYSPPFILGGFADMAAVLFFALVAVAFAAAVKFSPRRRKIEFELTATDYLVAFCLLAVLIVSRGGMLGIGNISFVVQLIIVFYACELLITEKREGWNWLSISSLVAGVILGVRGWVVF